VRVFQAQSRPLPAFISSCAAILLVVATAMVGLFPNLIPSRLDSASNLTIMNTSSGAYTLRLMAIVALVFVPIVVVYQLFVYRFFRSKTTLEGTEGGY
jgi:cytochrome d ubiquinol oxidase subunit II